jgi:tRNA-specific 2-thiouridylase
VTLGQRRGVAGGGGTKRFVVDVDVPGRRVVVGPESLLLVDREIGSSPTWTDGPVEGPVWVQCSAHGEPRAGSIGASSDDGRRVDVVWDEPQRRVSPGQSLVFYDREGGWVVGGATTTAVTTTASR